MYPSNLPQHRMAPQRMPVLIVDDMPENLFLLREYLSEIAHIEVYEASSGEQALTLASEYCFGLIILDVQMPGMSGFEVANELPS